MPVRAIVFDITGTLRYANGVPIPGAAGAVCSLRERGYVLRCLSNNPRPTPEEAAADLNRLGFDFTEAEILTSSSVAVDYVVAHHQKDVCLVMESGDRLGRQLAARGIRVAGEQRPGVILFALGGAPPEAALLDRAIDAIGHGASFLAASADPFMPFAPEQQGKPRAFTATSGVALDLLERLTGRPATIVGKPSQWVARCVLDSLALPGDHVLMVGDHLESDVHFAQDALGAQSALVLTGMVLPAQRPLLERGPRPPTYIVDSVADLPGLLP